MFITFFLQTTPTCSAITDMFGRTPIDLATLRPHTEVIDYLKSLHNTPAQPGLGMNTMSHTGVYNTVYTCTPELLIVTRLIILDILFHCSSSKYTRTSLWS